MEVALPTPTAFNGAKEASYSALFRRCWAVIATTLLLSMHRDIDWQLVPPYFYSRVACCGGGAGGGGPMLDDVVTYGGHKLELRVTATSCQCDLDATFGSGAVVAATASAGGGGVIPACAVPSLKRDSALWSHSARCTNFQYVQMKAQTLVTVWTAMIQLWYIPMMALFGKTSDIYGRRSVFLWTTIFTVILFFAFTLDAHLQLGDWVIYLTAPFMSSYYMHDVVAWSMVVDLVKDPRDQAKLFPLLAPVLDGTVAQVIGDVMAYFVLGWHLTDYTAVWATLTLVVLCASVFIWLVLPETMPDPKPFTSIGEFCRDILPPTVVAAFCGGGRARRQRIAAAMAQDEPPAVAASSEQDPENTTDGGYGFGLFCGPGARVAALRWVHFNGDVVQQQGGAAAATAVVEERRQTLLIILLLDLAAKFAWGASALTVPYSFGVMHFLQEERIYASLASRAAAIGGAVAAAILIPKLGPKLGLGMGTFLGAISPLAFIGLPGKSGAYVSPMLAAVGLALARPTRMMYLASYLRPSEITRAQSAIEVLANAVKAPAAPLFTALFYAGRARMDLGFAASAFVLFSGGVGVCWLPATLPTNCAVLRDEEKAAMLTREQEQEINSNTGYDHTNETENDSLLRADE